MSTPAPCPTLHQHAIADWLRRLAAYIERHGHVTVAVEYTRSHAGASWAMSLTLRGLTALDAVPPVPADPHAEAAPPWTRPRAPGQQAW